MEAYLCVGDVIQALLAFDPRTPIHGTTLRQTLGINLTLGGAAAITMDERYPASLVMEWWDSDEAIENDNRVMPTCVDPRPRALYEVS